MASFNSIHDYIDEVNDQMRARVADMRYVPADELGLDRRAAYRLWYDEDCIIVDKNSDRTLQYYGGFEYIEKEFRFEIGDYVVYLRDDDRVDRCLDHAFNVEVEEEEE